jgi:hypothetical protein
MGKRGPKPFTYKKKVKAFWSKVEVRKPNECWLWKGSTTKFGYGIVNLGYKHTNAHRFSLEIHLGRKLLPGLCSLHNCPGGDNPSCVNPAHLWEGTKSENSKDMIKKGRGGPPVHYGEKVNTAKLTVKEVKIIRRLYSTGKFKQQDLAIRFGVSQVMISRIIRQLAWSHI